MTTYLRNAGTNLGLGGLPSHDERYDRADEYLEVIYKLLEGSWEDGAVLRDTVNRRFADPSKIHPINHKGQSTRSKDRISVNPRRNVRPCCFRPAPPLAVEPLRPAMPKAYS